MQFFGLFVLVIFQTPHIQDEKVQKQVVKLTTMIITDFIYRSPFNVLSVFYKIKCVIQDYAFKTVDTT